MGRGQTVEHSFYCMQCGKKGIPLARKVGHQRGSFHRKKLYCVFCKEEVNHVECRNYEEVEKFKEDFENGVYKNEAENSLDYLSSTGSW